MNAWANCTDQSMCLKSTRLEMFSKYETAFIYKNVICVRLQEFQSLVSSGFLHALCFCPNIQEKEKCNKFQLRETIIWTLKNITRVFFSCWGRTPFWPVHSHVHRLKTDVKANVDINYVAKSLDLWKLSLPSSSSSPLGAGPCFVKRNRNPSLITDKTTGNVSTFIGRLCNM